MANRPYGGKYLSSKLLEAAMKEDRSQNKNPPHTEEKKPYVEPMLLEIGNVAALFKFDVSVNA
jgi:hypothetical protein